MRTVEELAESVRAQGGKVTSQRVLIWQALRNDKTHPTAEALYERLRAVLPRLSLTTLYTVLNELVEWGDVRRFDTGDGHIHFDPDTSGHAELICLRCHSVIDVPDDEYHAQPAPAPQEIAGYSILMRTEQYYGFCPACRAALATLKEEHGERLTSDTRSIAR
jgi:Fur family peroxide stress response transcriptional regulator